jgi:hypothetical protein
MNRNENETESFAGNFAASEKWRLFFEVPLCFIMFFPPGAAESEGPDGFLLDRADRKSQELGDLDLGKAIDAVQEEDLLSPWGQRLERGE